MCENDMDDIIMLYLLHGELQDHTNMNVFSCPGS